MSFLLANSRKRIENFRSHQATENNLRWNVGVIFKKDFTQLIDSSDDSYKESIRSL